MITNDYQNLLPVVQLFYNTKILRFCRFSENVWMSRDCNRNRSYQRSSVRVQNFRYHLIKLSNDFKFYICYKLIYLKTIN